MWKLALPERSSTSCSAGRSSSETAGLGQCANDVKEEASGKYDSALAGHLGVERDAEADVGIGCAELAHGAGRHQLDAGERLDALYAWRLRG